MDIAASTILSIKRHIRILQYSNHGAPQTSNEEDIVYKGPSNDGLIQRNSEGADASYDQTRSVLGYI